VRPYADDALDCVHLELTTRCNAACPMCPRNLQGGAINPLLPLTHLSLDDLRTILGDFTGPLASVTRLLLCGNYGDPIVVPNLLEMIAWVRSERPGIRFSIHTNGSARTTKWWTAMANILSPECQVTFSIDGLEDTNHLYRRHTDFNKIMENAKAFIAAGGSARWAFLIFDHNKHQMEAARQLAKETGFKSFFTKVTTRFGDHDDFLVLDNDGNPEYSIRPFLKPRNVTLTQDYIDSVPIVCETFKERSIYINAEGLVFPCCYLGTIYNNLDEKSIYDKSQIWRLIREVGADNINALKRPVSEIITGPFFTSIMRRWEQDRLNMCAIVCGRPNVRKPETI
jgi:MoaA/NifB/PqqE/SkfB family radical SAM enzyme